MNRKHIETAPEQQKNGEYSVQHSRKHDIFAACICLLLAFAVWLVVMNRQDSDYIATQVLEPDADYTYTLSAVHLEVEGTVAALRHAHVIGVRVPEGAVPGEVYELTEADLELPEGVYLSDHLDLTLTVEEK